MSPDTGSILVLGEGPRDRAIVPPLVESLLGRKIESRFEAWGKSHLRWGTGQRGLNAHGRKLLWAIKVTRADGGVGVIATEDDDKGREDRLGDLRRARERDRESQDAIPVAIGVPKPHIEAWLLDDEQAVRKGLALEKSHPIPSVSKVPYPKDALTDLFNQSPRAADGRTEMEVLPEIAKRVSLERSLQKKQTGLEAFSEDLLREFGTVGTASVDAGPRPV